MFVHQTHQLVNSDNAFMQTPSLWRDAVGPHPKYFVHHAGEHGHDFGISKFCAFEGITLQQYVDRLRYTTNGTKTRKLIEGITRSRFIPLADIKAPIRAEFIRWFFEFYPKSYDRHQLAILSV